MPEGTLQLEHLMQATKLLQLKKQTIADIDTCYDVCCTSRSRVAPATTADIVLLSQGC